MTATVGKGLQALGKILDSSTLSDEELDILHSKFLSEAKCAVYARVLVFGVLYSSLLYTRTGITNDSIVTVCFDNIRTVGIIRKFLSICKVSCTCSDNTFCEHYILVDEYSTSPFGVEDSITNADAKHIFAIDGPW